MNDEEVLIKLKRDWERDEVMKLLFQEITELKFKIGELSSECSEYKAVNHTLRMENQHRNKVNKNLLQLTKELSLKLFKLTNNISTDDGTDNN